MSGRTVLYIIPNLKKVSGGPKTRASNFKEIFSKNGGNIYEGNSKKNIFLSYQYRDLVYIESATNRIAIIDFFSAFYFETSIKKCCRFYSGYIH